MELVALASVCTFLVNFLLIKTRAAAGDLISSVSKTKASLRLHPAPRTEAAGPTAQGARLSDQLLLCGPDKCCGNGTAGGCLSVGAPAAVCGTVVWAAECLHLFIPWVGQGASWPRSPGLGLLLPGQAGRQLDASDLLLWGTPP